MEHQHKQGQKPQIRLLNDSGDDVDIVGIGGWSADQIEDFVREKLTIAART